MREGWLGDDYLILFAASELDSVLERYALSKWLPGYVILGLRNWDELIVRDAAGRTHTIPAVPMDLKYMSPFLLPNSDTILECDQRYTGKIQWHIKPIVFSGDPVDPKNVTWIDHEAHAPLVIFWNRIYQEAKGSPVNF
jgi:hypothetical protein